MSLVRKEMLTTGILSLVCIVAGICTLFFPTSLIALTVLAVLFSLTLLCEYISRKKCNEIWDEMAQTHYNAACKKAYFFEKKLLLVMILLLFVFRPNIILRYEYIFIFSGIISFVQAVFFAMAEKEK